MKIISIITINLNNKDGLRKTAESVVSQTAFSEIEWIVIDGGSSDGSLAVIEQYQGKITYSVSEPDKGIYNAMNKGLARSHGEYVLFLNSGDFLHDNHSIEHFLSSEQYGKYDFCVGGLKLVSGDNCEGYVYPIQSYDLLSLYKARVVHQSQFIRRNRFEGRGYDEKYKIISDKKFVFQDIVFRNATYAPLPYVVACFDTRGVSNTMPKLLEDEFKSYFKELMPPLIYNDYMKLMYGEDLLHKVIVCLPRKSIEYRMITLLSLVVFFPRWFVRKMSSFLPKRG